MPTSKVGPIPNKHSRRVGQPRAGVTLIELVLVMTIIALLAAVTYPTASAGLDSLRLRTAGERVVSLLNTALDRADRVQQVVEIRVSPEDNAISARSSDMSLNRTLAIPAPVHIASAGPDLPNGAQGSGQRRYLLYPGGTPPRISIELETAEGRKRRVSVDPLTGSLHSDLETAP
jgi:prepilin-type N-terminal cleavage/methylation domain-containing protein